MQCNVPNLMPVLKWIHFSIYMYMHAAMLQAFLAGKHWAKSAWNSQWTCLKAVHVRVYVVCACVLVSVCCVRERASGLLCLPHFLYSYLIACLFTWRNWISTREDSFVLVWVHVTSLPELIIRSLHRHELAIACTVVPEQRVESPPKWTCSKAVMKGKS